MSSINVGVSWLPVPENQDWGAVGGLERALAMMDLQTTQGIWLEVQDNYSLLSCTSVITAALNHPSRGYLGWKMTSKVKQTLLITTFFPINIINHC